MNQIDDAALATVIGGSVPARSNPSPLAANMDQIRNVIVDLSKRPSPPRSPFFGGPLIDR